MIIADYSRLGSTPDKPPRRTACPFLESVEGLCYLIAMLASRASVVIGFLLICLAPALLAQGRVHVDFQLKDGKATLEADRLSRETEFWQATGNVVIVYRDATLRADKVVYDPVTRKAQLEGNVSVRRELEWLKASHGDINVESQAGILYNVDGFTDEELFIRAASLEKLPDGTYITRDGLATACEGALPKWSFRAGKSAVRPGAWLRASNVVFRLKNVPVFYLPYLTYPSPKKDRASGFLLPSAGNSSNKGRRISQSLYLVLGRSSDVTYTQDYFSERGFGYGFFFRTRPNEFTRLELDGYAVDDRLDQGGAQLNGEGETRFGGYRAVSKFNIVSSFDFRRAFSDNFFTATNTTEASQLFISKTFRSMSINLMTAREETAFPGPNAVVDTFPFAHFGVSGQRLAGTSLYFDLDASLGGFNRTDSTLETPGLTQRLDLFPRVYFSLPLLEGLRVKPTLGLRNTFYSNSLDPDAEPGEDGLRPIDGEGFNRRYLDFTLDLQGFGLSRIQRSESGETRWKHLIEPTLRYRYIDGIGEDFRRTLLFDADDPIADTNEVEVALYNRFFVNRDGAAHELLSLKVAQKYFFDEDFGGALREGSSNQFFPLFSLTGFPYAAFIRNSSPITAALRFNPNRRISFDVRSDYDTDLDRIRNFSVTGSFNVSRLSLNTTYFNTQELEAGTLERNQLQQQIAWGRVVEGRPQEGLSLSGLYSYNFEIDRFLNFGARVNYFWDCCGISLQYTGFRLGGDDGSTLRDERQFLFTFWLKGVGFLGNIERPDRIF